MKLPDDDELYEVDETYLGPPGRYIGEMRHRALFAFFVIAPVTLVASRQIGIPLTLLSVGLWLIGSVWLSMQIADWTGKDSSLLAVAATFKNEVTAPRPQEMPYAATVRGAYVKVRPRGGWAKLLARQEAQAEAARAEQTNRERPPDMEAPAPYDGPQADGPLWIAQVESRIRRLAVQGSETDRAEAEIDLMRLRMQHNETITDEG